MNKISTRNKKMVATWRDLGGVLSSGFYEDFEIYILDMMEFEDLYISNKADYEKRTGKEFNITKNEFAKYSSYRALLNAGYSKKYALKLVKWDNDPFNLSKFEY